MTVEAMTMYRVVCDTCGATSPDENAEICAWSQEEHALDEAVESGFLATDDNRHYCEKCTTWDEEGENRIPMPVKMLPPRQPQPNTDKEAMTPT